MGVDLVAMKAAASAVQKVATLVDYMDGLKAVLKAVKLDE